MRTSRFSLISLLPLLLSLLLSACGDGGSAASAPAPSIPKAEVLTHVEEVDSSGRVVMRHNFSTGDSANEEVITTTQDPGVDGVWGTADDWRTLVTRCAFQPGGDSISVEDILPFQLTTAFWLAPQVCLWRRPLTGSVDIEMTGMLLHQLNTDFLHDTLEMEADPWGVEGTRELLRAGDVLGLLSLLMGEPIVVKETMRAERGSLVFCQEECSSTITVSAEMADCYAACRIFGEALQSSGSDDSAASGKCDGDVSWFSGTRYVPFYVNGHLRRVVQSAALEQPLCSPSSYTLYEYDANDHLSGTSVYGSSGEDRVWFTADDPFYAHMSVQTHGDEVTHTYSQARDYGQWSEANAEISRIVTFTKDAKGRRKKVASCYASGSDGQWGTPDDDCATFIFHYGAPS